MVGAAMAMAEKAMARVVRAGVAGAMAGAERVRSARVMVAAARVMVATATGAERAMPKGVVMVRERAVSQSSQSGAER